MPTFTKNLGLTKPDENDFYNQQTEQCENWDKLDEWSEEVDKKTVGATSSVPGIVKYGTDSSTALEGHRMAQSLGVGKFGGDVQTAGTKKVGYAYWCTVNKDMYVCKVENSLNYIDAAYFEAFSNNALLGKLNNLIEVIDVDGGWIKKYSSGIMELYVERLFTHAELYTFPISFYDTSYVAVFTRSKMASVTDFSYAHVNKQESTKSGMMIYLDGPLNSPKSFSAIVTGRWKK